MQPEVLFEGSGAELIEQVEKWKEIPHIQVTKIPTTRYRDRLPKDTVWKNGIPLFPRRENAEPITVEQIKHWQEDDE